MKSNWHRANVPLFDRRDNRPGTVSVFLDYNLESWLFGVYIERDESWYELRLDAGPLSISFLYWRAYMIHNETEKA